MRESESSFPFVSLNHDRVYPVATWVSFFRACFSNGVVAYGDELEVTPVSGMTVSVGTGFALIEGTHYYNAAPFNIALDPAEGALNRIDSIILQRSMANREITALYLKGTPGATPSVPTLTRETDGNWELARVDITVDAGVTEITAGDISDGMLDPDRCGIAAVRLESDLAVYQAQLASLLTELQEDIEDVLAGGDHSLVTTTSLAMTGNYGIFTGCAVAAQSTPDQTVKVAAGSLLTPEGKRYVVDAVPSLAATAASAGSARIDIVYVSSSGVVTYLAGVPDGFPVQPSTPANGTILASIYRAANDNTISSSDITPQRDLISTASDFEDVASVSVSGDVYLCHAGRKHTKNFSFTISTTAAKIVYIDEIPYGTCDVMMTIKATATAPVTWSLDTDVSRPLVWPNGAPTLTAGYTYIILFSYIPLLGKWVGFAQAGAAN